MQYEDVCQSLHAEFQGEFTPSLKFCQAREKEIKTPILKMRHVLILTNQTRRGKVEVRRLHEHPNEENPDFEKLILDRWLKNTSFAE